MIQSIWQILWLLGFSNSPGLAPFPGDLKWNPNVVCPPKDCWQIGCQHAPDTVSLLEKKCPEKWWLQPILVMHIRWMHYKGKRDRRGTIQNCRKQNWILDQTICYMTAVLVEETFQPPWEIWPETTVGSWQQAHLGEPYSSGRCVESSPSLVLGTVLQSPNRPSVTSAASSLK